MTTHPANSATTVEDFYRQQDADEKARRRQVMRWLRQSPGWQNVGRCTWKRIADGRVYDLDTAVMCGSRLRPYWAVWFEAGGLP